jgi:hypothetical protein
MTRARGTASAVCLVAAVLAAGCGGGGGEDAAQTLRQTSANLAKIHSGDLTLRLVLTPGKGGGGSQGVGVELRGPFSFAGRGPLPVARVSYTQIAGANRVPATFISTGRAAFVAVNGTTYRLARDQADVLRLGGGGAGAQGLDALKLDARRWMRNPKLSDGPKVGGEETDRVTGDLNAAPALSDLLGAASRAGSGGGLRAADARRLAETVRSSSIEVLTGTKDRLLRRVKVSVDLDVPESLRRQVGGRAALHVDFELGVARPNRELRVTAPKDARPLPKRQGG